MKKTLEMSGKEDGDAMNWKTKDGRQIAVSEMNNSHLRNAFKFVARAKHRATANYEASVTYPGHGEEATATAENAANAAHNKALLCDAWLNVFALELAKRELDKFEPEWCRE